MANYAWQPKEERTRLNIEKKRWESDWQIPPWERTFESYEPEVTMGAYDPTMTGKRLESPEVYWMPEEEWKRTPEYAEKKGMEIIGEWLMPIAALSAIPPAMAGWRALATSPQWLKYPARALLAPFAGAEKSMSLFGELAGRGVGKLVSKIKDASNLQKLEAHRMAGALGIPEKNYRELAKQATGKNSMTKMTQVEAERFIDSLTQMGGTREITVPFTGSSEVTKGKARLIARELSEYLGVVKPEKKVITKAVGKKSVFDNLRQKVYGFTNRTYRTERILDKMDGYPRFPQVGKMAQTFWQPVNNATDVKLRNTYTTLGSFRSFVAQTGIDEKRLFSGSMRIGEAELTTGERMGVYLHSLNKDNLQHLKWGNGFTDDMVRETIESLTPQERATADWIFAQWQTNTPRMAEAYKTATGKTMKTVENYTPIVIKGEDVALEDFLTKEVAYRYTKRYPSALIKKGFTKARTGKAKQPMELDALALFVNRLPEIEHYVTFTPVLRDLQRIYADFGFRRAVINKESKATYDVLGQWLKDVAATNPLKARSFSEKTLQQLRVNATTAVLGFNITTCFKQFPSFMIGAGEIGNTNALKGMFSHIVDPKATGELIKRLSPQIWKRSFEREIAEAKLMRSIGARVNERMSSREVFMFMTLTMDKFVVNSLWRGAFDNGLKKGFSEKVAAEYASRAIRKTQPYFGAKDIPEFWRSGEFMKGLTMFTNQLNQYWNYYRHDVWGSWMGRTLSTGEALKKTVEGFVIPALMIGAVTRSRPATDAQEFVTDLGSMALATVPVVGHFLTAGFRGWQESQGLITTEIMDKLNQFAYKVSPDRWDKLMDDIPELAELSAQMVGYAKGIPVTQPTRTIKGIIDLAQGNTDDWLRLIWSGYTREEAEGGTPLLPSP